MEKQQEEEKKNNIVGELASTRLDLYQSFEDSLDKEELKYMNPTLVNAAGLDVHLDKKCNKSKKNMSTIRMSQKIFTTAVVGGIKAREGRRSGTPPVVHSNELSPNIVYAGSGFKDVNALLTFVIIVSNGDIDKMTTKISRLTWFEEWFVFFELMHAKTLNSFMPVAAIFKIKK